MESITNSKEYREGVKKVGPGCKFYYRCIFDPVPNEDLKDPAKYGVEVILKDETSSNDPCDDDTEEIITNIANPNVMCGIDFSEMIRQRYSVRKYDSRPIEEDKLRMVLEAARVAPTAKDTQPFRLYVVKSAEAIKKLRDITPMAFDAPVVIMVGAVFSECSQSPFSGKDYSYIDTSIVTDHMMLQAQSLGLGTCWVGYFDPKVIGEEFDIPEGIEIKHLLPIGYPAEDSVPGPLHSKRKSLDELVTEL